MVSSESAVRKAPTAACLRLETARHGAKRRALSARGWTARGCIAKLAFLGLQDGGDKVDTAKLLGGRAYTSEMTDSAAVIADYFDATAVVGVEQVRRLALIVRFSA